MKMTTVIIKVVGSVVTVALIVYLSWVLPVDGSTWDAFMFNMVLGFPVILILLVVIWSQKDLGYPSR